MSHFYMTNGQPYHFIAKKDGSGMRPTTVADARRLGLLPGVTTVLKILHKEALVRWMVRQGAMAVLTSPRKDGEDLDAFMERVLATEPDEESQIARDLGGRIHEALEAYVSRKAGIPDDLKVFMEPALDKLRQFGDVIESEKVLVGDGYAGRTDVITLGACACLIDWKTAKTIPDEGKPAWPEHRLQLAAYAAAYRKPCTTANIYVSTAKPGLVRVCKHDAWWDTYERGFLPLLQHWQWANNISAGAEQASHPIPQLLKDLDPVPAITI